jgi:hypothetical protein
MALFVSCKTSQPAHRNFSNALSIISFAMSSIPSKVSIPNYFDIRIEDVSNAEDTPHRDMANKIFRVNLLRQGNKFPVKCLVFCDSEESPMFSIWEKSGMNVNDETNFEDRGNAKDIALALMFLAKFFPEKGISAVSISVVENADGRGVFIEGDENSGLMALYIIENGRSYIDVNY